jgi:hypothetical protein
MMEMRGFNVSEEIGVILLGFSVYDAVHQAWIYPPNIVELHAGEFGWIRAGLVLVFCLLIGSSLAISHQTNLISSVDGLAGLRAKSARGLIERIIPAAIATLLALAAIGYAWLGLGLRQAFLVWLGFGFANSGPWVERWTSRV